MKIGISGFITLGMVLLLSPGCGPGNKPAGEETVQNEEGTILLTPEQVKVNHLELGHVREYEFEEIVKTTGYLEALPRNRRTVTPRLGGIIRDLNLLPGDRVTAGQPLFRIENTELLKLQEELISASEELKYLEDDFERQKFLAGEEVAAQKVFLKAQSDFMTTKAKVEALRARLSLLGIEVEKIFREGMVSSIPILAPISGYVTGLESSNGKYASETTEIMNITETFPLLLSLQVFEKDITLVKEGQAVIFELPGVSSEKFSARVEKVGREIDEKRSVNVHALFAERGISRLLPGMFVTAGIITRRFTAQALPESALIPGDGHTFVLVRTNSGEGPWVLAKKIVGTGYQDGKMVEILPPANLSSSDFVVVNGTFGLSAE